MKTTFIIALIIYCASLAMVFRPTILSYSEEPSTAVIGNEYIIKMSIDHTHNRCAVLYPVEYEVQVEYGPEDLPFAGEWNSHLQLVTLNVESGMDIDTVAHESSHIVDTIMETWKFEDQHYEAYLVGRMTGCLWMLVEKDNQ